MKKQTKTIIGLGTAGCLLFAINYKKSQKPQPIETTNNTMSLPTLAGTPQNEIDYKTWSRRDWANFYRTIYENETPQDAARIVWQFWNTNENPNKNQFKNKNELIFNLALYREVAQVGDVPTITADSEPIYQTWSNWWNDVTTWDCEIWQMWFDLNRLKYGSTMAKNKFVNAWNHPDNFSYTFSSAGNDCGIDCDFVNYFRTKGIDVSYTGVETICNLVSVPSNLIDATAAATHGAKSTVNTVASLAPYAVVIAAGFLLAKQYKSYKKDEK